MNCTLRFLITVCFFAFFSSEMIAIELKSTAFKHEDLISPKYTCNGEDVSPELAWGDAPDGVKTFALIMDDPDAPMGTWDHWILFNLPVSTSRLGENVKQLPEGTRVGKNSWGRNNYGGPCPPDREHRYFFKLYALDTALDLPEGCPKAAVEKAMEGHILAEVVLMGRYDQPR